MLCVSHGAFLTTKQAREKKTSLRKSQGREGARAGPRLRVGRIRAGDSRSSELRGRLRVRSAEEPRARGRRRPTPTGAAPYQKVTSVGSGGREGQGPGGGWSREGSPGRSLDGAHRAQPGREGQRGEASAIQGARVAHGGVAVRPPGTAEVRGRDVDSAAVAGQRPGRLWLAHRHGHGGR